MKIAMWEVSDPKELPKSLVMTVAMKTLLQIRKVQITPSFLEFVKEMLTFINNRFSITQLHKILKFKFSIPDGALMLNWGGNALIFCQTCLSGL